jgi:DNA repair protein RAD50
MMKWALSDSDDALQARISNFHAHIAKQKRSKIEMEAKEQDVDGDLTSARRKHVELVNEQGQLAAEAKAQETRISERESLVRSLAAHHDIRGYDSASMNEQKVAEFKTHLTSLQRQQSVETERIRVCVLHQRNIAF